MLERKFCSSQRALILGVGESRLVGGTKSVGLQACGVLEWKLKLEFSLRLVRRLVRSSANEA